jgi:hypothetical protein
MDLQVGEVPRGAPMNEALVWHLLSLLVHLISELLQGLGHVPCAFRMTNPKYHYEFRSNSAKAVSYRSNAVTTWSIALLFTKLASPSMS